MPLDNYNSRKLKQKGHINKRFDTVNFQVPLYHYGYFSFIFSLMLALKNIVSYVATRCYSIKNYHFYGLLALFLRFFFFQKPNQSRLMNSKASVSLIYQLFRFISYFQSSCQKKRNKKNRFFLFCLFVCLNEKFLTWL